MQMLIVLLGLSVPYTPIPVNLSCGIPPIPPIGCVVGACQCDQNGANCRWTFICS